MQSEILLKIDTLENKARKVADAFALLKIKHDYSLKENLKLKEEIALLKEEIKNFKNQTKISKIVEELPEKVNDTHKLNLLIDGYIKEIDNCIAYINR